MPCHQCSSNFSLFRREFACPKCGFSYCNSCLKYKIEDDKNKEIKVCQKCQENYLKKKENKPTENGSIDIQSPECSSSTQETTALPDASPPITMINPKKNAWSEKDLNLLKRLQSLKEKDTNPSTINDIEIRLAKLKGESSPKSYKYEAPPKKTEEEETNDLIQRYVEESKLPTTKNNIAERLEKLKCNDEENTASSSSLVVKELNSLPKNEEDEVNELLRNINDEVQSDIVSQSEGNKKDEEIEKRLENLRDKGKDEKVDVKQGCLNNYVETNILRDLLSQPIKKKLPVRKLAKDEYDSDISDQSDVTDSEYGDDDFSDISEAAPDECEVCRSTDAVVECATCHDIRFCVTCFTNEHTNLRRKHDVKQYERQFPKQ